MNREYYICNCHFNENDHYFIWFTDEEDGVCVNKEKKLLVCRSLEEIKTYAKKQKISLKDEEPFFCDLDKLAKTFHKRLFEVNCVDFLNAWNLFGDISFSVEETFNSERKDTEKIYEKLFLGNNLPVITPQGKFYKPSWNKKELEIIRKVLLHGIEIFSNNLKYID
ncbi:MAG TPA: hypothetical protein PKY59_24940 [Pyrinomonadaceae bacterium]|nr:hypothetical protein [Pyrinomonadaceae bacterium]